MHNQHDEFNQEGGDDGREQIITIHDSTSCIK